MSVSMKKRIAGYESVIRYTQIFCILVPAIVWALCVYMLYTLGLGMVGLVVVACCMSGSIGCALWVKKRLISINNKLLASQHTSQDFLKNTNRLALVEQNTAAAVHDIRNSLMLIRENAGWIQDLLSDGKAHVAEHYESIDKSAISITLHVDKAIDIMQRTLSLAQQSKVTTKEFALIPVLQNVTSLLQQNAKKRHILLIEEYEDLDLHVCGNEDFLEQALVNIVDNALIAIGENGTVTVSAMLQKETKQTSQLTQKSGEEVQQNIGSLASGDFEAHTQTVLIRVMDSGKGIPNEVLQRIFEPLYTTKEKGKGTGLGLATSLDSIRKMGGNLKAENMPTGGACFSITLPTAKSTV